MRPSSSRSKIAYTRGTVTAARLEAGAVEEIAWAGARLVEPGSAPWTLLPTDRHKVRKQQTKQRLGLRLKPKIIRMQT